MAEMDKEERVFELIRKIGICMLASRDGEILRSRPMAAYFDPETRIIYFLTDAASHKKEELEKDPHVVLAFADTSSQTYLSVSGIAGVLDDRDRVRELWSTPAKAWWDSAEDPNIRVLQVIPQDAQYWDSPGTVISYVKMAAAAVSSTRPAMGENVKVNL